MALFPATDVILPSPAALERASVALSARLGSRVLIGASEVEAYAHDDSPLPGLLPSAVVLAESTEDLRIALEIAHDTGVPITPRAGGSGRTGGAVPVAGGIVLASHRLNRVVDIDRREGTCVVEPGVILDTLHRAAEAEGWFYPPDPNSSSVCCIAGNLAENAAGPRAFKYGVTRDYALGVEAFLPGGTSFFAGRRTKKGVTGYDVLGLLVGSEGTLATFGNATLRLLPKPERVMTLLALFVDMKAAAQAVGRLIEGKTTPRCIEFLDEKTLAVMRRANPGLRADAGALLIVEVDGAEPECERQAELAGSLLDEAGALEVTVAASDEARRRIWASRKDMSHAVRSRARHKLSEDVVVPRLKLPELLDQVVAIGEAQGIDALSYGHAGDGNLHVNFLWNEAEEEPRVAEAIRRLFVATVELGGTLSGEHGIGLAKAPYLALEQPPALIELQRRLKAAFDPRGVLNPGKILPSQGHGSC